jgi:hypothetical protein
MWARDVVEPMQGVARDFAMIDTVARADGLRRRSEMESGSADTQKGTEELGHYLCCLVSLPSDE